MTHGRNRNSVWGVAGAGFPYLAVKQTSHVRKPCRPASRSRTPTTRRMRSGHWRDGATTARRLDVGSAVPRGRHALVVRDGAGWRRSKSLEMPGDVSPLRLPPYGPEPNPVETVVRFLKQGNFGNQVFATAEEEKDMVEKV